MTLDEQIEWLQQQADDSYELAKSFLSIHSMKEYARYSDMADKYQSVIDSLEDCRKKSAQSVIGVINKKLERKIKDTPASEIINILVKQIEEFEAGEASTGYMLNEKYKVTITVEDIEG